MKNDTCGSRGSGEGTRTLVHDTPIQYQKNQRYFKVNDSKAEPFKIIADALACICKEGIVIYTKDDKVLANTQMTKSSLEPYNHEEVDTWLFVHARDAALINMQKVMIIGNDRHCGNCFVHILWFKK